MRADVAAAPRERQLLLVEAGQPSRRGRAVIEPGGRHSDRDMSEARHLRVMLSPQAATAIHCRLEVPQNLDVRIRGALDSRPCRRDRIPDVVSSDSGPTESKHFRSHPCEVQCDTRRQELVKSHHHDQGRWD